MTPSKLSQTDVSTEDMVNESYEPSENEEEVLDVLRDEWRANPFLIREASGLGKGAVNTALTRLTSAGWVKKVTRGLYEFVEDPRTDKERVEAGTGQEAESASHEDIMETVDGPTESVADDTTAETDEIIADWRPGRSADERREQRRAAGKAALEYLCDRGAATAAEFKQDIEPEYPVDGQSTDTWWKKTARPALDLGKETGVVEFVDGIKEWRWVGGSDE